MLVMALPLNILLMVSGWSPLAEAFPPSIRKPRPVTPLFITTSKVSLSPSSSSASSVRVGERGPRLSAGEVGEVGEVTVKGRVKHQNTNNIIYIAAYTNYFQKYIQSFNKILLNVLLYLKH